MIARDSLTSVVLPVYNEAACIAAVLDELQAVLADAGGRFEIVLVDDGSTDGTRPLLEAFCRRRPSETRLLALGANTGQSAAFWAGIQASRGDTIVLMDADGQNDPADIARCVAALETADICCGYRRHRQDSFSKRVGSRLANRLRRAVLKDPVIDTGCSLKAFRAAVIRPLQYWDGMHRFLPVLASLQGARLVQLPVGHRARLAGKSKYTNLGRLLRTVRDLFGVRWLMQRTRRFTVAPVAGGDAA